ncbi:hypothetical protein [Pedobacter miscanthi]|nr:hypothetical protein [Pedobacter miscanthi]
MTQTWGENTQMGFDQSRRYVNFKDNKIYYDWQNYHQLESGTGEE